MREADRKVSAVRIEAVWRDARDAVRTMRRRPGFTLLTVCTLAIGIGVNASTLAVAYGILLRPLPYHDASKLVILNLLFSDGGELGFAPEALQQWLPRLKSVESAAAYYHREVTVHSGARATVMPAAFVTERFFDVLGTHAESGHLRLTPGSPDLVVSRRVAQILGGDTAQPIARAVTVSGDAAIVSGVMPREFAFPDDEVGLWLPSRSTVPGAKSDDTGYSKIVARLKPGVTIDRFRQEAHRIQREVSPETRVLVSVTLLGESVVQDARTLLIAATTGALLVVTVACANVVTLFIGRDVSRGRELAARLALGASRTHLVRSVIVEMLLISMVSSGVGLALGASALRIFVAEATGTIPGLHRVGFDLPVALAIAGLTLLVALICAAVRARHAYQDDVSRFLRRSAESRPRAWHVRRLLVVTQLALSCVLLIGAGLLVRSVSVLTAEDHGFAPDRALEAKIVLSDRVLFDGARSQAYVQELLERVRAIPSVQHVGFGSNLPPRPPPVMMAIRLIANGRDETRFIKVGSATPGYLRALGARFRAGRDFIEEDGRSGPPVVILSESVARFYFPDVNPLGRTIGSLPGPFGARGEPTVIGVVADMKYDGLDSPAGNALYIPWRQRPFGRGYLIVRTTTDPMPIAADIRRAAEAIDATIPVPEIQTLRDVVTQSMANRRIRALPAAAFGLVALTVALAGVLGTVLTLVVERRRDLAIRSVLGADPARLTWTVLRHGLVLIVVGVAAGLALAGGVARALSSLVYGVSPYDPVTFSVTATLISGGATLTTFCGAVRARAIDAMSILKSE